jgi:hypothetical protein
LRIAILLKITKTGRRRRRGKVGERDKKKNKEKEKQETRVKINESIPSASLVIDSISCHSSCFWL